MRSVPFEVQIAIANNIGDALAALYIKCNFRPSLSEVINELSLARTFERYTFEQAGYAFVGAHFHQMILDQFKSKLFDHIYKECDIAEMKSLVHGGEIFFIEPYEGLCSDDEKLNCADNSAQMCCQEVELLARLMASMKFERPTSEQVKILKDICVVMLTIDTMEKISAIETFMRELNERISKVESSTFGSEQDKQDKLLGLYYLKAIILSSQSNNIQEAISELRSTKHEDGTSYYTKATQHRRNSDFAKFFFGEKRSTTAEFLDKYEAISEAGIRFSPACSSSD